MGKHMVLPLKLKQLMKNKNCNCIKKDSLTDIIEKRKKFHKSFGLPVASEPKLTDWNRRCLQYDMMAEELNEYLENKDSLTETADALIDMFEVLLGMFAEHGMIDKLKELYNEVHASNMSKLGKDGKPIYRDDGKVLKGERYFKPNFKKVLDE